MKSGVLAALIMGLVFFASTVNAATCTEVIGFSTVQQWYNAGFEQNVNDSEWQLVAAWGGSVDLWSNPNYFGWNLSPASACTVGSSSPDRVVFNIGGSERSVAEWADATQEAVETIRVKRPNASEILLMPPPGGPGHSICITSGWFGGGNPVRASVNHPAIDSAIAQVVANNADVSVGFSPEVANCSQYADSIGHLSPAGAAYVAQEAGEYYGE